MIEFMILGRLDGLNDYTKANRSNVYVGNKMKKDNQQKVFAALVRSKMLNHRISYYPARISLKWYEKDTKRDIDNVAFAVKFILDELVGQGVLKGDSQKYVNELEHEFLVDKENPRIEVQIHDNG